MSVEKLPDDIQARVGTMTAGEFCKVMEGIWSDVCVPVEGGGMFVGHADPEAYEKFHDANVLARKLQLELVGQSDACDGPTNVYRLPIGQLVAIAEHGGACVEVKG